MGDEKGLVPLIEDTEENFGLKPEQISENLITVTCPTGITTEDFMTTKNKENIIFRKN